MRKSSSDQSSLKGSIIRWGNSPFRSERIIEHVVAINCFPACRMRRALAKDWWVPKGPAVGRSSWLGKPFTESRLIACRRESNHDPQARLIVEQLDRSVMKLGDGGDRAEAKPVACRRSAALEPVEAPKHLGSLALRDARPAVCDLGDRARGLMGETKGDRRSGRGMTKSVLD